jgi:Mce-associated membrane protein
MSTAAETASGGPRRSVRARTLVGNGLVLAVLLASVLAAVLGWRAYSAAATDRATSAALDMAKIRTSELLSYSAPSLDADLARAKQQVTGDFVQRFDQLASTLIAPSTRQQGLTTRATVVRAAVVDSQPGRVVTLLFINQSTTTTAHPRPVQQTSQATVTMSKVGDQWLISDLTAL